MIHYIWRNIFIMLVASLLLATLDGCKPKRPSGILSPSAMEDILVDYHLAQGMAELPSAASGKYDADELRYIYIHAALKKHGVDGAVFDSSMVYYSENSEQLAVICDRVCARIEAYGGMATGSSASNTTSKYANLTAQGDTANVWTGIRHATLMPDVLHNLLTLTWQADTATRAGDTFVWHFSSQRVAQGNVPDTYAQVIVKYANDSTVSTTTHVYGDREVELYWKPYPPLDTLMPKSVTAMLYMSSAYSSGQPMQKQNAACALLLGDITLVRMHSIPEAPSDKSLADSMQIPKDTVKTDTTRVDRHTPGASPHRLTPVQLRDAHPHESTIQVQKERPRPFAPSRPGRPRRNAR